MRSISLVAAIYSAFAVELFDQFAGEEALSLLQLRASVSEQTHLQEEEEENHELAEDADVEADVDAGDELEDDEEDTDEEEGGEGGGYCNKKCDYQHGYMKFKRGTAQTSKRLQYYRFKGTPALSKTNMAREAVLVFHGVGHNPSRYFCYAFNAMDATDTTPNDVYILAIGMQRTDTALGETGGRRRRRHQKKYAAHWPHHFDWMYGLDQGPIVSFAAIDQVVTRLLSKRRYPNLQKITFLGHGGGGQFLHRYAVANTVDPAPGVHFKYVVANPSTLLFLNDERPHLSHAHTVPVKQCVDTPGWDNGMADCDGEGCAPGSGYTCAAYFRNEWCKAGMVKSPEFAGEEFDFPEENCCACGGGTSTTEVSGDETNQPQCEYYNTRTLQAKGSPGFELLDPSHPNSWLLWGALPQHEQPDSMLSASCDDVWNWPHGFRGAPSYIANPAETVARFAARDVVYMSAYDDACNNQLQPEQCGFCCEHPSVSSPAGGCHKNHHELKYPLIRTCGAMAQGLTRVERQWNYYNSLQKLFGSDTQTFKWVEGMHSSCGIFQSEEVRNWLFPAQ